MKLPQVLIGSLYGVPSPGCVGTTFADRGACELANQNIAGTVGIIGKIITYVN